MTEAGRKINMDDLKADSLVMLQLRSDPWWNSAWAFLVPALVARAQARWSELESGLVVHLGSFFRKSHPMCAKKKPRPASCGSAQVSL